MQVSEYMASEHSVSANGSLHQQPSTQSSGEGGSLLLALSHVDTSLNQMANTCMKMFPSVSPLGGTAAHPRLAVRSG